MRVVDERLVPVDDRVAGDAERERALVDPVRAVGEAIAVDAAVVEGADAVGRMQRAQRWCTARTLRERAARDFASGCRSGRRSVRRQDITDSHWRPACPSKPCPIPPTPAPPRICSPCAGRSPRRRWPTSRELHNATAGAPQGIAAARSLGDLSHNVYSAVNDGSDTILFIDHWNSLTGLGEFFGDPQVQAGAGQLFAERDAVVWGPTSGFGNHHLALPSGRLGHRCRRVRVAVSSLDAAAAAFHRLRGGHDQHRAAPWAAVAQHVGADRHPGEAVAPEILGVDLWTDVEQMNAFYELAPGLRAPRPGVRRSSRRRRCGSRRRANGASGDARWRSDLRSMSNPVGPRAAHARHRSRQRREGRLRAGRLPRRAATTEPILVVPTFADVDHYRRELAGAGVVFGVRVVAFSGLMREIARRAGVGGQGAFAPGARARGRLPRSPGCAWRRSRRRPPRRASSRLCCASSPSSRSSASSPGAGGPRMRAWGEREPRARGLRRGARARCTAPIATACGAIDRRDRVLHDQARARRAAPGARALGRDAGASSTASTTSRRSQRDAIETLAVHAGAAGHRRRWPTSPGARPSPGAARPSRSCMALGPEHVELPARAEHYARPAAARAGAHAVRAAGGAGAPDPGDALLLLEGGGERAELELVAAHVARLIARTGLRARGRRRRPARAARARRAARAGLRRRSRSRYALERTIAAGHTALGRGVVALLRCALAQRQRRRPARLAAHPGQARAPRARRPPRAARARRGGRDRDSGAARCGRPSTPTSSCTSSIASPRRRGDPAALCRRLAAECAALFAAPHRGRGARAGRPRGARRARRRARCARRWASSSAWRRSIARSCPAPDELARVLARPRGARARRPAPRARGRSRARARCAPAACGRPSCAACARTPSRARPRPSRSWATTSGARSTPPPGCACACARTASTPSATCSTRSSAARPSCSRSAGPRPTTRASRACARCSSTTSSTASTRGAAERMQRRPLGAAGFEAALAPTENEAARARLAARTGRARARAGARCATPACSRNLNARATWSASALEAYASCPVKWFVERLLRPDRARARPRADAARRPRPPRPRGHAARAVRPAAR